MTQNGTDYELKIFNDPIHGNISFNPACVAIIDTPQFQRLRHLKQLGAGYWVYPGAGHNRFEHSLGVCYLAGQFVRHLKNQEELNISERDVLCVEIAGLCHDLGHGPFSHTFDGRFIPSVVGLKRKWTHEVASKDLFDFLVEKNGLNKKEGAFEKHGLTGKDLVFIKELISPKAWGQTEEWPHEGRNKKKAFLYEIVANKRTGIDVDKFDYLARDCYQLGIQSNFDHKRFIQFTRVNKVDGQRQICLRDKEVLNLYNMFLTRYTLHKIAYQHEVVSAIDMMMAQAMIYSNNYIRIKGTNGKKRKMSKCIDDMEAYTKLNDDVISKILDNESDNIEMKEAKELIRRVDRRDLYRCVYESPPIDPKSLETEDFEKEITKIAKAHSTREKGKLVIEILNLDFGKGVNDPMSSLKVYSKDNPSKSKPMSQPEVSRFMPLNYSERLVRVYNLRVRPAKPEERKAYDKHNRLIKKACKTCFEKSFQQKE